MELKVEKSRVLTAAGKYSGAKDVLKELFPEAFKRNDFREIKTFNDACEELGIDPDSVCNKTDSIDERAFKKIKVIVKAINQGWTPDWNNTNQKKWCPWFNLSSGFGFDSSYYYFTVTLTYVGSRLCFDSEEKSTYCANQFLEIYKDLLT